MIGGGTSARYKKRWRTALTLKFWFCFYLSKKWKLIFLGQGSQEKKYISQCMHHRHRNRMWLWWLNVTREIFYKEPGSFKAAHADGATEPTQMDGWSATWRHTDQLNTSTLRLKYCNICLNFLLLLLQASFCSESPGGKFSQRGAEEDEGSQREGAYFLSFSPLWSFSLNGQC